MKKRKWYLDLNLADDKYIAEAHPNNEIKPLWSKILIPLVAVCACLALLFCSLWLFLPFDTTPPDVSRYSDSAYYSLIQKLNTLTFQPPKPKYKNNAEHGWT